MAERNESQRKVFGWTTCLTYEAGEKPLGAGHFLDLLDEMERGGMRRVIVMMTSEGYFDPLHHGLAWPADRAGLRPLVDRTALNADPSTEFFPAFLDAAHEKGIEVFVEMKFLGLDGIEESYPGIEFLRDAQGRRCARAPEGAGETARRRIDSLHICCDSERSMSFMRDKIEDILLRYPRLDGMVLEHPSYVRGPCHCADSRRRAQADLGKPLERLSPEELVRWKCRRVRDTLIAIRNLSRSVVPGLQLGFYTGFSPEDGDIRGFQELRGHAVETIREAGWDFVMPYCEGRHEGRETLELERVIGYLSPLPVYLHAVVRRESPYNYPLPPKDPAYVRNLVAWAASLSAREPRMRGMSFFNEVRVPTENRQAVYDGLAESFRPVPPDPRAARDPGPR